jgi:pyruvate, water dikinase
MTQENLAASSEENVIPFEQITLHDLSKVGGKNASLGEMISHLSQYNIKVPTGFATTAQAFRAFLAQSNLDSKIYQTLANVSVQNVTKLSEVAAQIRQWIMNTPFSPQFSRAIVGAYHALDHGGDKAAVAVRSSATLEDLPEASFAGQQETFLNVVGAENVLVAVKKVFASLFTERAIVYRLNHQFQHESVAISAGVQRMVQSNEAVSGVMFTIDTESGFDQVILINSSYGLGEAIVQGSVNPDEFIVYKKNLEQENYPILAKKLGEKRVKIVSAEGNSQGATQVIAIRDREQQQFSLRDDEVITLAKQALDIERHYGRPMDIEWAKDSKDQQLYIVQARPETVMSVRSKHIVEQYQISQKGKVLTKGRSIGQKIGQGKACIIADPKKMDKLKEGEILVTDMTDPDWEPVMKRAAAIVTNRGGRTCHAAIVARELGVPAVVGCENATQVLNPKEEVTISCAEGEVGYVYSGLIPFDKHEIAVEQIPELKVKLCLNLGNPEQAFIQQRLPNQGVGLARLEFIISQNIGIHPNAILNVEHLDEEVKQQILKKTAAYSSPKEFYIERLREGIATIAAAFCPKQVIFRFSDFKSNEYANLLGGKRYEPTEENPMLGFRGAVRYSSKEFRDCFALECEAFKRVRNKMALTNAAVMIPFVRTIQELKAIIELMAKLGLKRGQDDLRVYMMCEIPSNALLADQFLDFVDGFSIGSNDLTQLTLGVDRDSELVSPSFDERNDSVKMLLHRAISACKARNKYVGICGQAPSDYPEFADWLMQEGIESISLNSDSIVGTWLYLAER